MAEEDCEAPELEGPPPAVPTELGADCATPLFVHICDSDVKQLDNEYICDEATDTHWLVYFEDGVEISRTDTGIACADPLPADPTTETICRNGTIHVVSYLQDPVTGIATEVGAIDTGEVCGVEPLQFVQHTLCVGGFINVVTQSVAQDGTVTTISTEVTADECGQEDINFTTVRQCIGGFINIVTRQIEEDGTITVIESVATTEPCGATPQYDVELECIDGRLWQLIYIDGVLDSRNDLAACPDPLDFEQTSQCIDGTVHIVTVGLNSDGKEEIRNEFDTGQSCCSGTPECVESQQYTFGIDNTGSAFNQDEIYELELDDGSIITLNIPASANNTAQMQLWQSETEAGAAGLGITGWVVVARFLNNWPSGPNYANGVTDTSGGFGLPGPTSAAAAIALDAGGMYARYLDIQICPGSPLPKTFRLVSRGGVAIDPPRQMAQAGPILGPIQKYIVCRCCGEEPVYYESDGITPVAAGQEPLCEVPCGTSQVTPAPVGGDCTPFLETHCDDNGSTDPNDWTTITRQVIYCPGQDPEITYYEDDGNGGLIEVALVGLFVDCTTGQEIGLPAPPCEDFEITDLYRLDTATVTGDLTERQWEIGPRTATLLDTEDGAAVRENFDFSLPLTVGPQPWPNLSVNDANNASTIQDVQILDGYLIVDRAMEVRYTGGSAGYIGVELGECCGPLELKIEGSRGDNTAAPSPSFTLPAGIHRIRVWNIDDYSNTSRTFQYSYDGVNFTSDNTPPGVQFSRTKPVEECFKVKVCKDSGSLLDLLTGDVLDPATLTACSINCEAAPSGGGETQPNTHMVDGCILVGGVKVEGYTVIDDNGDALFAPRPMTDLGFEADCC